MYRWYTIVNVSSEVGFSSRAIVIRFTEIRDVFFRHLEGDLSSFTVDWTNQSVDEEEDEEESKSGMDQRPEDIVPTLRHHRFLHG